MNATSINVSYGTFIVTKVDNNSDKSVVISNLDGKRICTLPTYWWNKDCIINYLETHKDIILK